MIDLLATMQPVFAQFEEPLFVLRQGHALDLLLDMPANSVNCAVCSPPYFGVRCYGIPPSIWGGNPLCEHQWGDYLEGYSSANYGEQQGVFGRQDSGQGYARHMDRGRFCTLCRAWQGCLGLEPDVDLFIAHLVLIFEGVRRVLRSDGVLWVNLGDSYAQGGSRATPQELAADRERVADKGYPTGAFAGHRGWDRSAGTAGGTLKVKDLCLVPERFAIDMQRAGWYVRSRCLWYKPNALPQSAADRPSPDHEHVWMLTKSPRYWYCREGVRKRAKPPQGGQRRSKVRRAGRDGVSSCEGARGSYSKKLYQPSYEAYLRTVWTLNTAASPTPHSATYPPTLPRTAILLSTPEKCCGACGKPYDPVIEVDEVPDEEAVRRCGGNANGHYSGEAVKDYAGSGAQDPSATKSRILKSLVRKRITDWVPACECGAPGVPATVLDPFCGVGTTGWVARELGRRFVGFDLSEEYLEVARHPEGARLVWRFCQVMAAAAYGLEKPGQQRRSPKPAVEPWGQLGLFASTGVSP